MTLACNILAALVGLGLTAVMLCGAYQALFSDEAWNGLGGPDYASAAFMAIPVFVLAVVMPKALGGE